jgi:hypothetical protein
LEDFDTDGDGVADCQDGCPTDPLKTTAGACGCNQIDYDFDYDGIADCDPIYPCQLDGDCPRPREEDDYPPWVCLQEFCTSVAPGSVQRRRLRRLHFSPPIYCYCYNPELKLGRMPEYGA